MLKIMTLGDSLTWGVINNNTNNKESGGYRTVLQDSLLSNGFTNPEDFDFVGTRDDTDNRRSGPDSLIDQDNQGHRGWTIGELLNGRNDAFPDDAAAGNIDDWLASETPDLVLLMAGTNDAVINSISVADSIDNLESLINKITDSGAQVLVSSIPPLDESGTDVQAGESAKVITLNQEITDLVANLNSDQVQFIDINSQLDLNDISSDGIHLTSEAYSKLATIWHNALLPFLDPDTFDPDTSASRETPVRIEAEDFENLVEFAEGPTIPLNQNSQLVTDISVIELPVNNLNPITGTATTEFTLPDGRYDIAISYFDENDGVGKLQVSVGETDLPEFDLDQELGSGVVRTQNAVRRTVGTGVEISNGDEITITGTSGFGSGGELVRVDYIEFTPVNDSPILNVSSVEDFTTIDADQDLNTNDGSLVSEILGDALTDIDTDSVEGIAVTDIDTDAVEGIAVTAVDNTNGSWEYSTDFGINWIAFDSPSATEARLLDALNNQIRFVPNENYNGEASISFRAWDQTQGVAGDTADTSNNGGSSAFSEDIAESTITVNTVNDAPVLVDDDVEDFTDIEEDSIFNIGQSVSEILSTAVTDIDIDDDEGIAVTAVDNTNGSWEYSTDFDINWIAFDSPSATEARLLDAFSRIRFVPNENYNGEASISFRAWDQTQGVVGDTADTTTNGGSSAFSEDIAESTITVNPTNDAPVLVNEEIEDFTDIEEDPTTNQGNLVSEILSTAVTDIDTDAVEGIAVTGAFTGFLATSGSWEYSTDGGSNWQVFGTPSVTEARLLAADADTRIRFIPDENYNGEASISFRAWDQTEGIAGDTADLITNFGSSAFSEETAESTISINAVNNAPVLADDDVENFTNIEEDSTSNQGNLVSEILATAVTDIDIDAVEGIAVTEVDNTNGSWEYSTDLGINWIAFGTPSATAARLLVADANTRIRFVPEENYNGEANITFRAWDQTEGIAGDIADTSTNGGSSAFSEDIAESTITVNPVNDIPVANDDTASTEENTAVDIFVLSNDIELEGEQLTLTIEIEPINGTTVVSDNGTPADLSDDFILYNPAADFSGTDSFSYTISDGTDTDTATVTVEITEAQPTEPTEPIPTEPIPTEPTPQPPLIPTEPTQPNPTEPTPTEPTPQPPLIQNSDGIFTVQDSSAQTQILFTVAVRENNQVQEIGYFIVDDAQGNIGDITTDDPDYLQAALERGQVLFSVLDPSIDPSSATPNRQLSLAEGTFVRFYQLEDSTTDSIKLGQTTLTDVSLEVTSSTNSETLDFGNISLTIESTTKSPPIGTAFQGSTQGEILDLRGQDSLLANFAVTSDAAFNNTVGLYIVQNEQGTVIDPLTNQLINPGEAGYAEAAIRIGQNLFEASRDETGAVQLGGAIYAPFIIADGTTEQFLSDNPSNQGEGEEEPLAYFAYLGVNPDGVDHVRLLGDNSFGFEDLFAGGDRDYNDIVLEINIV